MGGTLGWKLQDNQYLKVSAEYLWQDIKYSFNFGNTNQWVQQGAVGAGYLYEFLGYSYDPQFNLNAYLSHAPNKSLHNIVRTSTVNGVPTQFTLQRRIAGSNGAGITPAVSVAPWQGGRVGLGLNYDNVRYDTNLGSNHDAKGFGGTVTFNQAVTQDIGLNLAAGVRQPFNNYDAGLTFANVPSLGKWVLGVDGEYTAGKNTLPNTWNLGLSGSYDLDQRPPQTALAYKDNYKDQLVPVHDSLLSYASDPAVYMPQVLAIPDQEKTQSCPFGRPTFSGTIGNQTSAPNTTQTFNSPTQFAGTDLAYSVSAINTGAGTSTTTINPNGVVTVTGLRSTTSITVTATDPCGQTVSSNTFTATFV